MFRASGLVVGVGLALLAGAAHAVEFTTTWVGADSQHQIRCRVANVGSKPVKVLAEVIDAMGANVAGLTFPGCDGVAPLAANGLCSAVAMGPVAGYCRFTSSSKKVRPAMTVEVVVGNDILQVIPATR